jgi:hypothetical protein
LEPTIEAPAVPEAAPAFPPLTTADRCDSCGETAQAQVRVVKGKMDMLFCKHHFEVNEPVLFAGGWEVFEDVRQSLYVKPGASA